MRFILSAILLFTSVFHVQALNLGTACTYTQVTRNMAAFNPNITLDPNAPVGTIIYRRTQQFGSGSFKCTDSTGAAHTLQQLIESDPGGDTVTVPGYGKVYKTSVAGLGVLLVANSTGALSNFLPNTVQTMNLMSASENLSSSSGVLSLLLIKYADIPLGASTATITLPSAYYKFVVTNSTDQTKLPNSETWVAKIAFPNVYTIKLLSQTCNAQNRTVSLGEHSVYSLTLDGTSAVSPWVDASVTLTGCPRFYGIGKQSLSGTTQANVMNVTITPGNASVSDIGVMPVDSDVGAATRVGIQLGWGDLTTNTPVDFSVGGVATKSYTLTSSTATTFTIPLVARLRQTTSSRIGAGDVKGKVTYSFNYY